MSSKNAFNKYKQTAVLSASKERILLMLYEGAIRFTRQAKEALLENRIADKGQFILKAYDIVAELQASLDHNVGGDLPKQLDQLYTYLLEQYSQANMQNDAARLDSCIKVLENLYEGWKQIIDKTEIDSEGKGGAA